MKYHGLDQGIFDKIEEALKLDVAAIQKRAGQTLKKEEESEDSMMQEVDELRNAVLMSAVKQEFHDAANDEGHMIFPDIRNVADHEGTFLKNINSPFELPSPIQPSRLETKPQNSYQHNLNLSLELQKLVDEHRMMEDYPLN